MPMVMGEGESSVTESHAGSAPDSEPATRPSVRW